MGPCNCEASAENQTNRIFIPRVSTTLRSELDGEDLCNRPEVVVVLGGLLETKCGIRQEEAFAPAGYLAKCFYSSPPPAEHLRLPTRILLQPAPGHEWRTPSMKTKKVPESIITPELVAFFPT